jgi:hypothetical protein
MAVKPIVKTFEYFLDRLLRGFRKDQGREPNNLEMILIRQEAGGKAKDANKVIEVQFGKPFGEEVDELIKSGDVKIGEVTKKNDNVLTREMFENSNLNKPTTDAEIKAKFDKQNKESIERLKKKKEDDPGFYTGGITDVEPSLDDIGHGSDSLMSRTRLMSPGSQATTSTGLNYLLAEDNDNLRVPFAKGKIAKEVLDKGRRGFMKTAGAVGAGIAALKTGLLGLTKGGGKEVIQEAITTANAPGKPAWFDALVTRVIREGDDVTKKFATKDREIVYRKKIDDETEVLVTQDLDNRVTRIDIDDSVRNVTGYDDPPTLSLQVTDEIVEEGGIRIKPKFKAIENDYRNYATDPDGGYETEFVENVVENTKDLTSDLTKVKSFATKKGPTMKEIVGSKKRKDNVKYANEKTSSYAADRGPDYDPTDYVDDMADDFADGGLARMLGE